MSRVFISNGVETAEVIDMYPDRGTVTLLKWADSDHGLMYTENLSKVQEEGYQPVEAA